MENLCEAGNAVERSFCDKPRVGWAAVVTSDTCMLCGQRLANSVVAGFEAEIGDVIGATVPIGQV